MYLAEHAQISTLSGTSFPLVKTAQKVRDY